MKLLISLLVLFSSITACASDLNSSANQVKEEGQEQAKAQVSIKKFKFIPQVLEIKKGQSVRWTNNEKRQYHSVWFKALGDEESEYLFPEDTFEKTFDKPGEYDYVCGPHPEMTGKIIVK